MWCSLQLGQKRKSLVKGYLYTPPPFHSCTLEKKKKKKVTRGMTPNQRRSSTTPQARVEYAEHINANVIVCMKISVYALNLHHINMNELQPWKRETRPTTEASGVKDSQRSKKQPVFWPYFPLPTYNYNYIPICHKL